MAVQPKPTITGPISEHGESGGAPRGSERELAGIGGIAHFADALAQDLEKLKAFGHPAQAEAKHVALTAGKLLVAFGKTDVKVVLDKDQIREKFGLQIADAVREHPEDVALAATIVLLANPPGAAAFTILAFVAGVDSAAKNVQEKHYAAASVDIIAAILGAGGGGARVLRIAAGNGRVAEEARWEKIAREASSEVEHNPNRAPTLTKRQQTDLNTVIGAITKQSEREQGLRTKAEKLDLGTAFASLVSAGSSVETSYVGHRHSRR